MSGGVVCYIERQPGGTGIKRLRLIAAGLARTWTAPEPRSVLSVDSSMGGGPGPTVGAAKAGAMWIAETLAAVGLKRLAAVCVDSEGSICAWLSAPSPEPSVVRATIIQSGVDGDGSGAGVGAARLLTMADGDAALTGQTSLQALATLEPEEAEIAAPAAKGKGLSLRRKAPVIAARKQRYAVVAIQDAVVRVLLDELDARGIEVERTVSLWHAMAGAWDRNDASFSDRLSASSPSAAVILVEPHGRLVWAWTRAGELVAGGSMRLSTPPRRTPTPPTPPTPATPAAPGAPAAHAGATDALATQTAAAESARRTVFESPDPDEGSSNIEFTAADAGRLAVDWLAWSAQLGHCPQRVVCLSVPAVSGGGLGPEALFSHLSKAWPGATIDGAVHEDPIGATVGRLAGLGPEISVMPGERVSKPADEMPYHYRPREALIGLTARPGVADRRLHQWIGVCLFAAAGFIGVMGWQIRSSIGTAEAEIKITKKTRDAALDSASAVVPGGKANNKAEDALRSAVTRVQDQLRALKPPRPVLEETVRLLGALRSVNEDPATSGGAARTLMNELEMNSFAGKLSLQVPDAATGPTILEKVLETDGVLVWNGSTGYTPAGQPGRNYILTAPWPETNVITRGRKPTTPAPPPADAGSPIPPPETPQTTPAEKS